MGHGVQHAVKHRREHLHGLLIGILAARLGARVTVGVPTLQRDGLEQLRDRCYEAFGQAAELGPGI
eukprot:6297146-Pyramimonas_sp.AAC.1